MPPSIDALDALITPEIMPDGPGAVVGVIHHGEVIHTAGYGFANLEWLMPIDTNTVFRLASITKPLTACGVLLLAERGALSLDDPVTRFLPAYPTGGHHLTVYHLLTHTGGICNERAEGNTLHNRYDLNPYKLLAHFSQRPFAFKPGTDYRYSNTGYVLLGLIIEAVSGQPYADFMLEQVYAPLGMQNAHFFHHRPIIPHRASGYKRDRQAEVWQHARFFSADISYAGGGLGMSLSDLLLWVKALVRREWLTSESWAQMVMPGQLDDGSTTHYGLGIALKAYHGHVMHGHSGTTPGFHNQLAVFPDDALAIVVLSNQADFDSEKVTAAVARHLLGIEVKRPRPYVLAGEGLAKCMGEWISDGHRLRFMYENGDLILRGARQRRLIASGRDTFYAPDNADLRVTFADERDGRYTTMTLQTAFSTYTAHRPNTTP